MSLSFLYHANRTRFITEAVTHHFNGYLLVLMLIIHIHLVEGALLGIDAIGGLHLLNVVLAVLNVVNWSIVLTLDFAGIPCGCITQLGFILFVLLLD